MGKNRAPKIGKSGIQMTTVKGEIFTLKRHIGGGAFGSVWTLLEHPNHVLKMEPVKSGALFSEQHFYQRSAMVKPEIKLVPKYLSFGVDRVNGWRFIVIERFDADIKKLNVLRKNRLAMKVETSLEDIHRSGFTHGDIKDDNVFMSVIVDPEGYRDQRIVLGDFSLVRKFPTREQLKEVKKPHGNGTRLFMSIDSHKGMINTRSSDYQNWAFWLVHMFFGDLPWAKLSNPDDIQKRKQEFFSNPWEWVNEWFEEAQRNKQNPEDPTHIVEIIQSIARMKRDDSNVNQEIKEIRSLIEEHFEEE